MIEPISIICAILRGEIDPDLGRDWSNQDWLYLVAVAREHGVAALLHTALAGAAIPDKARTALRAVVVEATGHNLRLYRTIAAILAATDPAIPVIVLKGAALGPGLYPSPALRPLTDIDLLVPQAAIPQMRRVMERLGFREIPALAPELLAAVEAHATFIDSAEHVTVEIHWKLTAGHADWRTVPVGWFLQQTVPWQGPAFAPVFAPANPLMLTPTAGLLYQTAHLVFRHGNMPARLIWLYDLHLLVTKAAINWDVVLRQADDFGWRAVLQTALQETARCFATPLPAALHEPPPAQSDRQWYFHGPASSDYVVLGNSGVLAQLNLPARLWMWLRIVLPNPAYLRAQYQQRWGNWWPLAYPYRWLKPLRRRLRRIAGRGYTHEH